MIPQAILQLWKCREHEVGRQGASALLRLGPLAFLTSLSGHWCSCDLYFHHNFHVLWDNMFAPILTPAICFSQLFKINFGFVSSFKILCQLIAADVIFIITFKDCCHTSLGFLSLQPFAFVLQTLLLGPFPSYWNGRAFLTPLSSPLSAFSFHPPDSLTK